MARAAQDRARMPCPASPGGLHCSPGAGHRFRHVCSPVFQAAVPSGEEMVTEISPLSGLAGKTLSRMEPRPDTLWFRERGTGGLTLWWEGSLAVAPSTIITEDTEMLWSRGGKLKCLRASHQCKRQKCAGGAVGRGEECGKGRRGSVGPV